MNGGNGGVVGTLRLVAMLAAICLPSTGYAVVDRGECIHLWEQGQRETTANTTACSDAWARYAEHANRVRGDSTRFRGIRYQECFERAAKKEDLPVEYLLAITWVESAFQPSIVSSKGAKGLMQLMPPTARDMGLQVEKGNDERAAPCLNVRAGAKYLRTMLDRYNGDFFKATGAYYVGPGNMDRKIVVQRSDWYAERVLHMLAKVYRQLDAGQGFLFRNTTVGTLILREFEKPWHAKGYFNFFSKKGFRVEWAKSNARADWWAIVLRYEAIGECQRKLKELHRAGYVHTSPPVCV